MSTHLQNQSSIHPSNKYDRTGTNDLFIYWNKEAESLHLIWLITATVKWVIVLKWCLEGVKCKLSVLQVPNMGKIVDTTFTLFEHHMSAKYIHLHLVSTTLTLV